MKVLLINGSPHKHGCTYTALAEIVKELEKENIDGEIFQIGTQPIRGCVACNRCSELDRCSYEEDIVNEVIEKARAADGFIFGSPVHFASAGGAMTALMDRLFYAAGSVFAYKPGASVVSARRAGTTAAYDQLNKYIGISKMIMVPSQYWNMVHGNTPEEVQHDKEGLQIMRTLGKNMAWLLKLIANGKENGIQIPEAEQGIATNFI
jgi:multimeric flavodoxin WrbA